MILKDTLSCKADLFFSALAGDAVEAQCGQCGVVEWVIPIDGPVDDVFLANFECDECEAKGLLAAKA